MIGNVYTYNIHGVLHGYCCYVSLGFEYKGNWDNGRLIDYYEAKSIFDDFISMECVFYIK